jgi:hypothetical protein
VRLALLGSSTRQGEVEGRAGTERALHPNAPPMRFDDAFGDVQSQPRARTAATTCVPVAIHSDASCGGPMRWLEVASAQRAIGRLLASALPTAGDGGRYYFGGIRAGQAQSTVRSMTSPRRENAFPVWRRGAS